MRSEPAITMESLTKRYGAVRGVEDLHLAVAQGEIFGFLGPNGAGKTTTIRLLLGFLRPTHGRASVFGHDIVRESVAIRSLVGFAPGGNPYEQMSGHEVLQYLGALQGQPPTLRRELCQRLQLSERDLRRNVREYSKGMRQKLGLVQAMQHDPPLLILDEPTEGLDPLVQRELFRILLERHQQGRTIFMSSHILSEVERLCQRVAIIRNGRLVAVERVETLRQRRSRRVEVRLAERQDPRALADLPGATVVAMEGAHVHFTYRGELAPLLRVLAALEVEDLVIEHPSLEEAFLAFYADSSATSGTSADPEAARLPLMASGSDRPA